MVKPKYKARKEDKVKLTIIATPVEDPTWVPPWCQLEESEVTTPNKYRTIIHEN